MDKKQFRQILGTYPTGVCAITAMASDGTPLAMVVGTFTSVSLEPPLVGFLPDKSSSSWPRIAETGQFCVNVLGADQQHVCRTLAMSGGGKFLGVPYTLSERGQPVIEGSPTCIECTIVSVTEAGDHWFVLGRIIGMEVNHDGPPLLFHRGQYGTVAPIEPT